MVLFAAVMIFAGSSMIRNQKESPGETAVRGDHSAGIVLLGILVGAITGLVGAGGGFLIIPALVLIAGLPVKTAIGTSLLIIAVNSLIGFLGDVHNQSIHWIFLLEFTGLSIAGIFLGSYVSKFVDNKKLKSWFGYFIITMSVVILAREIIF
jgi:uncharacterized membrane protein YfcA